MENNKAIVVLDTSKGNNGEFEPYDPALAMPTARSDHDAVFYNGKIYILGGKNMVGCVVSWRERISYALLWSMALSANGAGQPFPDHL